MSLIWKPKRVKYKRLQKGRIYPLTYTRRNTKIAFGYYGLKILKDARLTAKQLEASRRMISRNLRKKQKVWLRCIPNTSFTTKPLGIRMGKGKGVVDDKNNWVYKLQTGKILFEISLLNNKYKARRILLSASKKLPVPSIIINRIIKPGKSQPSKKIYLLCYLISSSNYHKYSIQTHYW